MDWLSPFRVVFGFVFPFFERLPFIRAILGILLVFFLPGFAWSFIFFNRLHALERIALSIALSIALVTLSVFAANWLGHIRVTGLNSLVIIIVVTILPVIIYYLNRRFRSNKGKEI